MKRVILFLFFIQSFAFAVGLRTKFSMAVIQNIFPGETYNTRELVNLPYVLTNTSPFPIIGGITVQKPIKEMLIKGYEPIPDTDWIDLSKKNFRLEPGESIVVDIMIYVPDKEEFYAKRYQANIEATGRGEGGNIAAGLITKLCFTTVMSKTQREKIEREKKILANLNYEVLPGRVRLRNIVPGKKYELGRDFNKFFKIVNMNDATYSFSIRSVTSKEAGLPTHKEYEDTPDTKFLWFEKSRVTIPDNTIQKMKVFLKIPKKKEFYGKRFEFFIEVNLLGQEIPVRKFSFVYVDTIEK